MILGSLFAMFRGRERKITETERKKITADVCAEVVFRNKHGEIAECKELVNKITTVLYDHKPHVVITTLITLTNSIVNDFSQESDNNKKEDK